jgi:hypothetical protein
MLAGPTTSGSTGITVSQPTPPPADGQQPSQQPYQQPYQQQPYQQQPYPQGGYAQGGYTQQGYGYAPSTPNNTMALVSLIAGIGGLTILPFIASIVAVITGHIAKKQISETGEGGSGLATGGLVTGYIGIGLGILGIIIVVVFWGALMTAATTSGY